ncbi:ABC transporter permease [Catalinimonas alkaloidigena]|uniref:ABC transporter permease n=1 Tax=Catalinimonas alkaloidigena TaxID=1075417 RepID=UPI00240656BB|nr:ABC transporter permease [Catalinimonas alkaloidigena]
MLKNKFYTFINVVGLALGISSSLLIGWYVMDELSYDDFHQDAERTFRVITNGGAYYQLATTPPPLAEAIKSSIPEVEQVARAFTWNHSTMRLPLEEDQSQEKVFRETAIFIVDPEFLEVLNFKLIAGEVETALRVPNALVLTRATAERYFGEGAVERGEVLGKEILFGGSRDARFVSGVVDPGATHFPFDMLVATTGYQEITNSDNWAWNVMHTYLKVRPSVADDPKKRKALKQKLDQIVEQHARPFMAAGELGPEQSTQLEYELQAVSDIHLHSDLMREHEANGSIETVYVLMIVAILIVLLACINFMNLTTAQATRRAKEVGVRKVLGAPRKYLVFQFLLESLMVSLIAMLLALATVEILRIPFNKLVGKDLIFDWLNHPLLLASLVGGIILIGLLSGSYPALYLSAFRPISVLKGKLNSTLGIGRLRNALIVFQFVVSIGLIISTALVVQQLHYIQTKDIGYERENVLVIKNDKEIQERWKEFKEALLQQSQVKQVSFASGVPLQSLRSMRDFREEGAASGQGMQWFLIDQDYISTLELEVIAGRAFRVDRISDHKSGLLLNEAAVKALGLEDPLGKRIIKNKGENDEEQLEVIGVVKDFNIESFDRVVKPVAMQYYSPTYLSDYAIVRLNTGDVSAALAQVEGIWSQFEPENPFVYSFLDQDFDRIFRAEQRLGNVLKVFTALAILVASMGLLGLVAFVTARRTKEIGIRKVLGASVVQINHLIASDFLKLVLIAFVVAAPLSYWMVERWLNNFAYRTEISIGIFVLAGLAALLIAWLTISFQSIKAALANPVDSLRDE